MISFVDTSVFIAAFQGTTSITLAVSVFSTNYLRPETRCRAHTLAELFSVLTRLPKPHRLLPDQAFFFVERIAETAELVWLDADEYLATVRKALADGTSGGTVYDALLVTCARKVTADAIYTWNVRHFRSAAPDLATRILEPGS